MCSCARSALSHHSTFPPCYFLFSESRPMSSQSETKCNQHSRLYVGAAGPSFTITALWIYKTIALRRGKLNNLVQCRKWTHQTLKTAALLTYKYLHGCCFHLNSCEQPREANVTAKSFETELWLNPNSDVQPVFTAWAYWYEVNSSPAVMECHWNTMTITAKTILNLPSLTLTRKFITVKPCGPVSNT